MNSTTLSTPPSNEHHCKSISLPDTHICADGQFRVFDESKCMVLSCGRRPESETRNMKSPHRETGAEIVMLTVRLTCSPPEHGTVLHQCESFIINSFKNIACEPERSITLFEMYIELLYPDVIKCSAVVRTSTSKF